ncbi:MAG TPA: hypothetical protein VGJ26_14540 [Pirellulales bacterium]|jgi:hypothetical protein
MNYFTHGRNFIDDPWLLAGTAVPDLLNVSDRGVRVRAVHAAPLLDDADPRTARLARGIAQHHFDDGWFHQTAVFAELSWGFAARLRDVLEPDPGMRPSFLGHILVEILLDAVLIEAEPDRLRGYYAAMATVDAAHVQEVVNQAARNRPATRTDSPVATRLAEFLPLFVREGFLWDYADDGKLCYRLNQVMRRVRLPVLGEGLMAFLPEARRAVLERQQELLTPDASIS